MLQIYGLKNCDTTKKALAMLKNNGVQYQFHDYKTEGADKENLKAWLNSEQGKELLNKKGTTWRALSPEEQSKAATPAGAVKLMQEYTSLIKRPVAVSGNEVIIGFKEKDYRAAFGKQKK